MHRNKTNMTKLVSVLLAVILVATMTPALAFATASEKPVDTEGEHNVIIQDDSVVENGETEGLEQEEQSTEGGDASQGTDESSEQAGTAVAAMGATGSSGKKDEVSQLDAGDSWVVNYWLDANKTELHFTENVADGALALGPDEMPEPNEEGAFIGWYEKSTDTTPVDLNTKLITANSDFIAKFSNVGAVVQFRSLTGDILNSKTLTSVATIADITPLPTALEAGLGSGEQIDYWYLEGSDGSEDYLAQSANTPLSGVITLCPKVAGMYTVFFDSQYGSLVSPVTVPENGTLQKPSPDPVKAGYTLLHWSTTPGGEAYDFDTPVTKSFTLYAVWESAEEVGFHLVYWTSDYRDCVQPDKRTSWANRTTVVVTEDTWAVGSTLKNEEIAAMAAKYFPKAVQNSNILKYICAYYENDTNKPLQTAPLSANGKTVINVYYTPPIVNLTFDMSSEGGHITNGDSGELSSYAMGVNYGMYFTKESAAYEIWPYDASIRTLEGSAGVTAERSGYVLGGWRVKTPESLAGTDLTTGLSGYGSTLNQNALPYYGSSSFNQMTVEPVWIEETQSVLLHYYPYNPVLYADHQAIEDPENPAEAIDFSNLGFETGAAALPQYIAYDDGDYQGNYANTIPRDNYSTYITKSQLTYLYANNYLLRYNANEIENAREANWYRFSKPLFFTATFDPGDGLFSSDVPEDQITISRQYFWPILLDGFEPPIPTILPQGKEFEGWYVDPQFKNKLTSSVVKESNNQQRFYAKYVDLMPAVSFYDAAVDGTQIGSTIKVTYNQSLSSAGKTLPTSPAVGDVVAGKGEFKGWYFMLDGVEYEFTADMPLTEASYTVYASYKQVQYTVTFHDTNGSPSDTRKVFSDPTNSGKNNIVQGGGTNRRMPTLAAKEGYVACWTTQPDGGGTLFTSTTLVTGDMNAYAYYDELITINYETLTGGTGLTRASETIAAKHGTPLGASISALDGYELAGWYNEGFMVSAGAIPDFVPTKDPLGSYVAKTYTAKFKAVINYQSSNESAGTVSPTQEKVFADEDSEVQGSTATDGVDAEFFYWLDSHGEIVGDEKTFKPLASPATYTAVFVDPAYAVITYKVVKTGEQWGGSVSLPAESILINTGDSMGSTAEPYAGFEFAGWSLTPDGPSISEDLFYKPLKPTDGEAKWKTVTYYARFMEAGSVTINYKTGLGRGTVAPAVENVPPLSGVASGSTPSALPGYSFSKWTTDAAGNNGALATDSQDKFVPLKEMINDNQVYVAATYFAHFEENEASISYQVGTAGGGSVDNSEDLILAETGDESLLVGSTPTASDGYSFVGWALDAAGSSLVDASWVDADNKLVPQKEDAGSLDPVYSIYKSATYYAIFAPNKYEIEYDANGGSGSIDNQPVVFNTKFKTNDGSNYSRTGYHLVGWSTSAQGGQDSTSYDLYTSEYVYATPGPLKLYAQWDPNTNTAWKVEHYRVSASGAGTTTPFETENRTGTTDASVSASYRDYSAAGYSAAPQYAGTLSSDTVKADGSLVLKLYYTQNLFTVNFVDWNGAILASQPNIPYGGNATAPGNPTRVGYTFIGWDKAFTNVTSNLTVNALYAINAFTITFVDYDGSFISSQNVNYGGSATPPANPTRAGYTFTGWSGSYTNVTSNVTITAQYTPANAESFTITFISHGDVVLQSITVERGESVTPPENPTRAGYTFLGWDKESSAWTNVTADATIRARWEENTTGTTVTPFPDDPDVPTTEEQQIANQTGNPFVDIAGGNVPLGSFTYEGAWSLLSLILVILTLASSLFLGILSARRGRNEKEKTGEQEDKDKHSKLRNKNENKAFVVGLIAILVGVVALIAWFLLDDLTQPMVWINSFTVIVLAIFVVHVVLVATRALLLQFGKQEEEQANETAQAKAV